MRLVLDYFQLYKEYYSILTWEWWVLVPFLVVIVLSAATICIIAFLLKYKEYKKYFKKLNEVRKKAILSCLVAVILTIITPLFFVIFNKVGFVKGSILFIAPLLFILSMLMLHDIFSIKKRKKDRRKMIFSFFIVLIALISLIAIFCIAIEVDYKDRKSFRERQSFYSLI